MTSAEWEYYGSKYIVTESDEHGLQALVFSRERGDWVPVEAEEEIETVVDLLCDRVRYYENILSAFSGVAELMAGWLSQKQQQEQKGNEI